ncbi:MFS transporter [Fulvivirga lutimaris]|uniref:MFS transporter n=1 Tax=Fulvivirga lutimaris TaxID=1819566 RepID=UPI0012BC7B38|nr:MFS transporter [Fulvivirga lutimaris]MTI38938.1 MFS transporter [Fulvivirga lutimaris]
MTGETKPKFTQYQFLLVAIIAIVLLTIVLDYMLTSALSAILLPELKITTKQFGLLASAYPISAGITAILLSGYADKFDRKKLLLFFYSGFLLGVLFCASAPTFNVLIVARIITGTFGGVVGPICFAIIADLFETTQRGRAMGILQMASAGSQILGLPLALYLASEWDWHLAFGLILLIGIIAIFLVVWKINPVKKHLHKPVKVNPWLHSLKIISKRNYLIVFFNNTLLVAGDVILMTFSSAFCTNNLGVGLDDLPLLYGIAGVSTFVFSPLIGRLTDKYGTLKIFVIGTVITILTVGVFTNLEVNPLWTVIIVHTFIFLGVNARSISSSAIGTVVPEAEDRGAFMAVDAAMQLAIAGLAAMLAGWIVFQSEDGMINNFSTLGVVVMSLMVLTIGLMFVINRIVQRKNTTSA